MGDTDPSLYDELDGLLGSAGDFKIDLGDMTPEKRTKLRESLREERSKLASGTEAYTATVALLDTILEQL